MHWQHKQLNVYMWIHAFILRWCACVCPRILVHYTACASCPVLPSGRMCSGDKLLLLASSGLTADLFQVCVRLCVCVCVLCGCVCDLCEKTNAEEPSPQLAAQPLTTSLSEKAAAMSPCRHNYVTLSRFELKHNRQSSPTAQPQPPRR